MCEVGWPIENRGEIDVQGVTLVAPDKRLCRGQVTKWIYQRNIPQMFQAIVFRPTLNGSDTEFKIIGINKIYGTDVQTGTPVTYEVQLHERITVQEGDVIGWSSDDGVIPFNNGGTNIRWIRKRDRIVTGETVNIRARVQEREYSIKAVVEGIVFTINVKFF